jgi:hypothetical protein
MNATPFVEGEAQASMVPNGEKEKDADQLGATWRK